MSRAVETRTAEGIDVEKVRELANSDRDTAWIYRKWLDHYAADSEGESK